MRIIIASAFLLYAFALVMAGQYAQVWAEKRLKASEREPMDLRLAQGSRQNRYRTLLAASIDYGMGDKP